MRERGGGGGGGEGRGGAKPSYDVSYNQIEINYG